MFSLGGAGSSPATPSDVIVLLKKLHVFLIKNHVKVIIYSHFAAKQVFEVAIKLGIKSDLKTKVSVFYTINF